jgi:regulator of cell morphogenesis and NO signaling
VEIDETSVMRDVVLSTPGATLAFDRFHVDYCCGGGATLAAACAQAGASVADVLAALREEAARPNAAVAGGAMLTVPLEGVVDHLLGVHHARSRAAATELLADARAVAARDGRVVFVQIVALLERLFAGLLPHLDFEERYVFPYVVATERALDEDGAAPVALFASIAELTDAMDREHRACDEALHALAGLARPLAGDPDPAVGALAAALDAHERDLVRHKIGRAHV